MSQTIPSTDPPLTLMVESGQFRPFYSPKDMLILGIFGGTYFGKNNAWPLYPEFKAKGLFDGLGQNLYLNLVFDVEQNNFQVDPGKSNRTFNMPLPLKRFHPHGWFQWYLQFYYGEKSPADVHRIRQWAYAINIEWAYIAELSPYAGSGNRKTDLTFLPERRQRLLEKGWDPTKDPGDYGLRIKF